MATIGMFMMISAAIPLFVAHYHLQKLMSKLYPQAFLPRWN